MSEIHELLTKLLACLLTYLFTSLLMLTYITRANHQLSETYLESSQTSTMELELKSLIQKITK